VWNRCVSLEFVTITYKVLEKRWGIAKPRLKIESNLCKLIILVARVIIRDILKKKKREPESEDNWKIYFS
jgi:hypothetical protein